MSPRPEDRPHSPKLEYYNIELTTPIILVLLKIISRMENTAFRSMTIIDEHNKEVPVTFTRLQEIQGKVRILFTTRQPYEFRDHGNRRMVEDMTEQKVKIPTQPKKIYAWSVIAANALLGELSEEVDKQSEE